MTGVRSLLHIGSAGSRWLLPLMGILLISATLTYAMNSALTGSRATAYGWPPASIAQTAAEVGATDAFAREKAVRDLRGSCASLFGSYNFWLYDKDSGGPCGLDAAAVTNPPSDR